MRQPPAVTATCAATTAEHVVAAQRRRTVRAVATLVIGLAVLITLTIAALSVGPSGATFVQIVKAAVGDAVDPLVRTAFNLRGPRVLLALLTGVALALTGAAMQTLLRNPLADPFTLGLSSGAALGAALAIVAGFSVLGRTVGVADRLTVMLNAFLVACLATLLVMALARLRSGSVETVLLGGVALSFLFSAGVAILKYTSSNDQLRDLELWLMGSFTRATWSTVVLIAPVVLVGSIIVLISASSLNALALGAENATVLGVPVRRLRLVLITTGTAMTAAVVSVSGVIGFVGLIAPHLVRYVAGSDHRYLLPACALLGAALMTGADLAARTIASPAEIPVGIITSLFGVPVFVIVLLTSRTRMWG